MENIHAQLRKHSRHEACRLPRPGVGVEYAAVRKQSGASSPRFTRINALLVNARTPGALASKPASRHRRLSKSQ
jgi:hypothetical protein